MTNAIQRPRNPQIALWLLVLGGGAACNAATDDPVDSGKPSAMMTGGSGGAVATGGTSAAGTGGAGSGGTGKAGTGGSTVVDAGHPPAKLDAGTPPIPDAGHPDAAIDAGIGDDALTYAAGLNELFIDAPCDAATPNPPPNMATCQHPPNTQHIEKMVTFGGEPTVVYAVKLRVRGIWEPTWIDGGQHPDTNNPVTVGGTVKVGSGDPINYQQYYIKVTSPGQTYWLNDYQYVAHDIHKEDYEATIQVNGGSSVVVVMNDGNDHEIANWTKDYFEGLEPYATAPSTGQMLRLDVVSVVALHPPTP